MDVLILFAGCLKASLPGSLAVCLPSSEMKIMKPDSPLSRWCQDNMKSSIWKLGKVRSNFCKCKWLLFYGYRKLPPLGFLQMEPDSRQPRELPAGSPHSLPLSLGGSLSILQAVPLWQVGATVLRIKLLIASWGVPFCSDSFSNFCLLLTLLMPWVGPGFPSIFGLCLCSDLKSRTGSSKIELFGCPGMEGCVASVLPPRAGTDLESPMFNDSSPLPHSRGKSAEQRQQPLVLVFWGD